MGVDIIIPAYNAKDTLFYTLSSIAIQKNIEDIPINVYLINDCSDYKYSYFTNYFKKFMDIKEIYSSKNLGPGGARNLGINSSKNDYIIFIDSDDVFHSPFSLRTLYDAISKNNYDFVISSFIYERDNKIIVKENNFIWLHGKIYSRKFLDAHKIRFNDSRANEDNGFNKLILLSNPYKTTISDITYVYKENKNSITRKDNRAYKLYGLEGFVYNMEWAIQEGLKRNCSKISVIYLSMSVLVSMYFYYMELSNEYDVSYILKWSKPMLDIYKSFPELSLQVGKIHELIVLKENEYAKEKIAYYKSIEFDEFLIKVGEVND